MVKIGSARTLADAEVLARAWEIEMMIPFEGTIQWNYDSYEVWE